MSKMFAVVNNVDKAKIFVKRGEVGFWPCREEDQATWAKMHDAQGAEVTQAALCGSIFGWDTPIAAPANAA